MNLKTTATMSVSVEMGDMISVRGKPGRVYEIVDIGKLVTGRRGRPQIIVIAHDKGEVIKIFRDEIVDVAAAHNHDRDVQNSIGGHDPVDGGVHIINNRYPRQ